MVSGIDTTPSNHACPDYTASFDRLTMLLDSNL